MSTRITVIGSAGTHPSATRVCSSYLVSHGGTSLLLDAGMGALHNLQKVIDLADLTAVLISHMHPDHFVDLYGLNYAMRFHPAKPAPLPVYGPRDLEPLMCALLPEESIEKMVDHMHLRTVKAGDTLEIGPFHIELFLMNHPVECLGSRITVGDTGTVIAFTGDTAPTPEVGPLAADADLLMIDATWLESQRPLPADVHNTGLEAGAAAEAAGAKRLLITHVSPYVDPLDVAAEASTAYSGEVIIATDLQEILL